MSAVSHEFSEDLPKKPPAPSTAESQSGLKPIQRLTSDERLARINPTTLARTEFTYYSRFNRDFLRSDYSFAAAKMAVARNGKQRAIENEFRVADAWFAKMLKSIMKRHLRIVPVTGELIELEIKHALSGRLVRLLVQYDHLFIATMGGQMARTVSDHDRQTILNAAEARIKQIPFLCIPDTDRFTSDGLLIPDSGDSN
jgi:hypothetical protein